MIRNVLVTIGDTRKKVTRLVQGLVITDKKTGKEKTIIAERVVEEMKREAGITKGDTWTMS